jgi:hypothetical protein
MAVNQFCYALANSGKPESLFAADETTDQE